VKDGTSTLVKRLDPADHSAWERYIRSNPKASFYHRLEWKGIIESSFGHSTHYLAAVRGDRMVGVLPLVHVKSLFFGSMLCSMPFLNYGGVIADDAEAEAALLQSARELMDVTGAACVELRGRSRSSSELPVKTHKVSSVIDLSNGSEALLKSFASEHRRRIRAATSRNLQFHVGGRELLDDFYSLLSVGWKYLGTPLYRKSFFENILGTFKDSVHIALVDYEGTPVAAAMDGRFGGVEEGLWTYSLRKLGDAQLYGNYFLFWKLFERACEDGCKLFHLGRSTAGSPHEYYKKKWGAESRQLYWEYLLRDGGRVPELNVENKKYQLAIDTWRKLPLWLIKIIGPPLARCIP
jgi:FemAB-related protein (PEP-CTERM system-associated)